MRPIALHPDEKTFAIIEGLARIQCTQSEAAAVLGVSRFTVLKFFKRHPQARDRWENGLASGKASLRRNQFKLSETNAAMAIWLGKQFLGQREPQGDEPELGKKEAAQRAAETGAEGTGWNDVLEEWKH